MELSDFARILASSPFPLTLCCICSVSPEPVPMYQLSKTQKLFSDSIFVMTERICAVTNSDSNSPLADAHYLHLPMQKETQLLHNLPVPRTLENVYGGSI